MLRVVNPANAGEHMLKHMFYIFVVFARGQAEVPAVLSSPSLVCFT